MPEQTRTLLQFPKLINESTLSYNLHIVPSCIAIHRGNIALGYETGIVVLSSIPSHSKILQLEPNAFASEHIYQVNTDYANICKDVSKIKYSGKYIVALNFNDELVVINHIDSTQFSLSSAVAVDGFDLYDDLLVVLYLGKLLKIWDLANEKLIKNIKVTNTKLVKFINDTNGSELLYMDRSNVVKVINWQKGTLMSQNKLKNVIDIIPMIKPIAVHNLPNSMYIRPELNGTKFGNLISGILEVNGKRIDSSELLKYIIVDGEMGKDIAIIIAGAKLFIIKV